MTFRPESIVSTLAALGPKRSEKESQMLARFLSASVLPSLKDESSNLLLEVKAQEGLYLGIFSGIDVIQNLDGPTVIKFSQHSICPVSIRSLISQPPYKTTGVILNPFSDLAIEFPWRKLAVELGEYDKGTRLTTSASPEHFKFEAQIWDPAMLSSLQQWVNKRSGVAQMSIGLITGTGLTNVVKIYLDCVSSVFDDCKKEVSTILHSHKKTLPGSFLLSIAHCEDSDRLERMRRAGANLIIGSNRI